METTSLLSFLVLALMMLGALLLGFAGWRRAEPAPNRFSPLCFGLMCWLIAEIIKTFVLKAPR